MYQELLKWDIYEIRTKSTPITGVMLRGRIRKFCLENKRNVLVENAQEIKESVRFAIPSGEDSSIIQKYINKILSDASINLVEEDIPNPVLSKLKVNVEDRYTL
ncbi:TPA: hypothetical protein DGT35_00250 [Patescibacteria group bacterium]|nr:hypothetical protein [Patescibacteria group bacterium]|tara:strand:- start:653 stop:964 length:312 start_codon:yes stop_codon:yes gene_type:complete